MRYGLVIALLCLLANAARALPAQLPEGLQWQTNVDDPIFASPKAERGGRFRAFVTSFPLTLRLVGPDSNSGFAQYLRANALGLVEAHPNTRRPIPALATHWAYGDDGKSLYFRLDPDARWSDGEPVTADDYLFTMEFMRSEHIVAPWYNNYYSNVVVEARKYGEHTIGIEGAHAKPRDEMLFDYGIRPTPEHFHTLDEHWVRDYNWKIEPNTGPYQISAVRKGRYVEFERKRDWWGNGKRYYRHRFNVDYVRVKVIRDINIAYQYFSKGLLDSFPLESPRFWHRKAQGRPYERGHIGKIVFYNEVPRSPMGMFLNEGDPLLADRQVRLGLSHAINVDKVIRTVLRNDYERLQTMNEGYGEYTNLDISPRSFDLDAAARYFKAAGWDRRGPDGIRHKDGERLSLRVTYYSDSHTPRLVVIKQEARKAGVELRLQLLDPSAAFKQIMEKKHQIAWMAWSGGGLSPRYWEFFHSENADRPQTNNITNTADAEIDALIEAYRSATEKQRRVELAHQLEARIHRRAVFIPTFKVPYTRSGFWRWLRLPEHYGTRSSDDLFAPFGSSGGLFWIDTETKEQVESARILGEEFPPIEITDKRWRVKP